MDPSHARRYTKTEIEKIVAEILSKAYPAGINIDIDIDWLIEKSEIVDDIVPADLLEDKFEVAAIITSKSNGHFDILVDEDTLDYHRFRANFSIAHEFGHIVLHSQICTGCHTIEDSIALRKRIKKAYNFIERNANYFAGAILIPRRTIFEDASRIYEALVKDIGYNVNLVRERMCSTLAQRYNVTIQPMEIRLKEVKLERKISKALQSNLPYLDL
ncbi:ImmA/IrrE family metallo-endopeptidase [Planctomycetota bacterium]